MVSETGQDTPILAGVNHVGVTVGDIDHAVRWYGAVFGLQSLMSPFTSQDRSDVRMDVFGPRWRRMKSAHLVGPNGVGLELFEPVDPVGEAPAEAFSWWRFGVSHLAFWVEDINATISLVEANGGRRRTGIHQMGRGCDVCYCEDPWGTQIELTTSTYTELVSTLATARSASGSRPVAVILGSER